MTAGKMSGAGLMVTGAVCLAALIAVLATAYRFAITGELDQSAVSWSSGLVAVAAALLARTYTAESHLPAGTPADPVATTEVKTSPWAEPRAAEADPL